VILLAAAVAKISRSALIS